MSRFTHWWAPCWYLMLAFSNSALKSTLNSSSLDDAEILMIWSRDDAIIRGTCVSVWFVVLSQSFSTSKLDNLHPSGIRCHWDIGMQICYSWIRMSYHSKLGNEQANNVARWFLKKRLKPCRQLVRPQKRLVCKLSQTLPGIYQALLLRHMLEAKTKILFFLVFVPDLSLLRKVILADAVIFSLASTTNSDHSCRLLHKNWIQRHGGKAVRVVW